MSATSMHRKTFPGSDPGRRTMGWLAVVALHVLIGWALVTGTARKAFEIIKKPMEAAVIQEVIIPPPPPPPPPKPVEKPVVKQEAPPPPFVPPAEVTPPPSAAPSVAAVTTVPTAPAVIAPPPPPPAPPAPAPTGRMEIGVACPTQVRPEMPKQAVRDHIEGVVKAQARIEGGRVKDVTILSGPRVFHAAVRDAMMQYQCVSGAGEVLATQEFGFKIAE